MHLEIRIRLIASAAVAILTAVALVLAFTRAAAAADLTGDWEFLIAGGYNDVCEAEFVQTGSDLSASFQCVTGATGSATGTIIETATETVIDLDMVINPVGFPPIIAEAVGTVAPDGNSFEGSWTAFSVPVSGTFSGTRATPVETPTPGTVDFDWSVPDRFGDADGDGMLDYFPPDGTEPIDPEGWRVDFVVSDAATCDSSFTREWSIEGSIVGPGDASVLDYGENGCTLSYEFPQEGVYVVTLTVRGPDDEIIGTKTYSVVVQDWLIISIGDSVASGEGNPDLLNPPRWQNEQCHRSGHAGPAQAALRLEEADPKTSVTFIHLACSGATILEGLIGGYRGIIAGATLPPQVSQMADLVGDREVDAVLISIGANDVKFSHILTQCLLKAACDDITNPQSMARFFERRALFLFGRYAELEDRLGDANPNLDQRRTYITEYFDPTRDDLGRFCHRTILADHVTANALRFAITAEEAEWASTSMLVRLNGEVQTAAAFHGWNFVTGIYSSFATHGYCAADRWVVRFQESKSQQGDQNGTIHPNRPGHAHYGSTIAAALLSDFYPSGDLAQPRHPR